MNEIVTIVILTKDEEIHIARCIESIARLNARVVVVDSGSKDQTVEIARNLGAEVYFNEWKNYASQFQWGLDETSISTPWVMRMDADEYFESDLIDEILDVLPATEEQVTGYYIRRKVKFLGRWIRWGGHYPQVLLRIWRHGQGRIEQRWMDEHVVFDGPATTDRLDGHIVDDNQKSISWWIEKHNGYASREVVDILLHDLQRQMKEPDVASASGASQAKIKRIMKEKIYARMPLAFRTTLYFFYRYVVRLGVLDGRPGFFYHFMQGYWYRTLVDLKLAEVLDFMESEGLGYDGDGINIAARKVLGLEVSL